MKDVAARDKSRGGGKQPLIREFPNGVTRSDDVGSPTTEYIGRVEGTWGSETSQYPEEKKTIYPSPNFRIVSRWHFVVDSGLPKIRAGFIPSVAASERGTV